MKRSLVTLFASAIAGGLVTLLCMLALRPVARGLGLLDRPGGHKQHEGAVPLVGGVAMFMGLVAALGISGTPGQGWTALLGALAVMVTVGLVDDRYALSAWSRLPFHLVATLILVTGTGFWLQSLGNLFGQGDVQPPLVVGGALTLLVIVAAINAFNMLDGMDGLLGSVALLTTLALAALAWLGGGLRMSLPVSVAVAGVVAGYLVFNWPARWNRSFHCFMGDAGSTMLGAVLAWLGVRASQLPIDGHHQVMPVLWIFGLPAYEITWATIRRARRGQSPMHPDREHFHHVLRAAGFSLPAALWTFMVLHGGLIGIGLATAALGVPPILSLALFAITGWGVVRALRRAPDWVLRWPWLAGRAATPSAATPPAAD